jgi:hypothetical protein
MLVYAPLEETCKDHWQLRSWISRRQVSNGAEATAKVGEPSEREALLTILLNMPARECLGVISLWGAKELVMLFCQLKAGHIYTYGLFVHVSMCM